MKHAELKEGRIVAQKQASFADVPCRCVEIDGIEYLIQLKSSTNRRDHRFDTKYYAVVERPGYWYGVVPAPPGVRSVEHLWYRELLELVSHARLYVTMRKPAA